MILIGLAAFSLLALCVLGTYGTWKWISTSRMFMVDHVEIDGCHRVSEKKILELSRITRNDNLLALDLQGVADNIKKNPWIARVEIRRILPDKVKITVQERKPVAFLNSGKIYLIDTTGNLFKKLGEEDKFSLPIITGIHFKGSRPPVNVANIEGIKEALRLIRLASRGVRTLGVKNISQIHIEDDGHLVVYTSDRGIPFRLNESNLDSQFAKAERVLYHLYNSGRYDQIAMVDMDYGPDRAIARPRAVKRR